MPLLDTKQLAEELNFSESYIRTLAHRGDLPSIKVTDTGEYRFDLDEVKAALLRPNKAE